MAHQAEEAEGGRRDGAPAQLLVGETGALALQSVPLEVEETDEQRALVDGAGASSRSSITDRS